MIEHKLAREEDTFYWHFGKINYQMGVSVMTKSWTKREAEKNEVNMIHFPTDAYLNIVGNPSGSYSPPSSNLYQYEARAFLAWQTLERIMVHPPLDNNSSKLRYGRSGELKVLVGQDIIEEHFVKESPKRLAVCLNALGVIGSSASKETKLEFVKKYHAGDWMGASAMMHDPQYYLDMGLHHGDYSFEIGRGITVDGPEWIRGQFDELGFEIVTEDEKGNFISGKLVKKVKKRRASKAKK